MFNPEPIRRELEKERPRHERLVEGLIYGIPLLTQVWLRRDMGRVYCNPARILITFVPLFLMGKLVNGYGMQPVVWFWLLSLLRCMAVNFRAQRRHYAGRAHWHSRFVGVPVFSRLPSFPARMRSEPAIVLAAALWAYLLCGWPLAAVIAVSGWLSALHAWLEWCAAIKSAEQIHDAETEMVLAHAVTHPGPGESEPPVARPVDR